MPRANPVEVSFLRVLMASGTPMRAKTMQAREKEARLGSSVANSVVCFLSR